VEKRLKKNFLSLKNRIEFQQNKTEELMKNINQESLNIQSAVYKSQTDIHDSLKNMKKHCKTSNYEKNNEN
jgi:N-acetylmuramic acid 6-phosphate (MurNAc-6-P) etherase